MAHRHRKQRRRVKRVATLGAATATITALTVGVAPPTAQAAAVQRDVRLQSGVHLFPPPDQIPDLTGGLGSQGYDLAQQLSAQLLTAIVENINLAALAQAAGIDPESIVNNLVGNALNQVLNGVLGGVLAAVPIDLSGVLTVVLTPALTQVLGPILGPAASTGAANFLAPLLGGLLGGADVTNLGALFAKLGLDLSNPLDLSGDPVPGLNVVTSGWAFDLLKMFGPDLGWVPPFANPVAEDINNTEYLRVGVKGLLDSLGITLPPIIGGSDTGGGGLGGLLGGLTNALKDALGPTLGGALGDVLGPLVGPLIQALPPGVDLNDVIADLPDVVALRVPIVVGIGLGAFAAGAAYQQVVNDLPNQPGGLNYTGTNPLLGSFTILPMLLLDNPGRANGGILARAYPFFRLLGIDTVTPDTQVEHSGGIPLLNTGLSLGGANLIPIKIDATFEYLPGSDFAAWPNPFTLANNMAAGMFPTYILRGLSVDDLGSVLTDQLTPQLLAELGNVAQNEPLALNFYLTIPAGSLPLLEPTYLMVDAINLLTGMNFNNPIGTALSPMLTSLVNLGYTDVYYDSGTGVYMRTLDEAGVPTAFGTLPANVDWAQVPVHLVNNLVSGISQAFSDGLVNQSPVPNPLKQLLGLLGVGGVGGLNGLLPAGGSGLNLAGLTDTLTNLVPDAINGLGVQNITKTDFEPQEITSVSAGNVDKKPLSLDALAGKAADIDQGAEAVKDAVVEKVAPDKETATATSVVDEAKSKVDSATDKVAAAADDASQEVRKTVRQARERMKASAEQARENTARAARDAQARVNRIAEDGRRQIRSAAEGTQTGAQTAAENGGPAIGKGDSDQPGKKSEKRAEKRAEKKERKKDAA